MVLKKIAYYNNHIYLIQDLEIVFYLCEKKNEKKIHIKKCNYNELEGNAFSPIEVTLFGIVIFVSDEHSEKAEEPILVTLFGIVIFVSDEHP